MVAPLSLIILYHKLMRSQLKLFGAHGTALDPKLPDDHENAAEVVIDSFVSAQIPFTLPGFEEERRRINMVRLEDRAFGGWIDSQSALGLDIPNVWLYSAVGAVLFVLFCGVCRYINTYDAVHYQLDAKETELC